MARESTVREHSGLILISRSLHSSWRVENYSLSWQSVSSRLKQKPMILMNFELCL